MKKTKSKGFTLIELMVVIAIISLLSSIVLASLKGVRERAVLNKAVSEMKSLQTALELYKNQFGIYPGELSGSSSYDDDVLCNYICGLWDNGDIHPFFTTELVNKKLISKVPHAPNYPNNCNTNNCSADGYVLGYSVTDSLFTQLLYKDNNSSNEYAMCGNQRVKNYVIYLAANNKKINLPIMSYSRDGATLTIPEFMGFAAPNLNVYCISM